MHRIARLIPLAAFLIAAATTAADVEPLPFHELDAFPEPVAIPWAESLAGGPIRVVAIAPYSALGDIARLEAHLELDLDTAAVWDEDHLGFDPLYPEPSFPDAAYEAVEERLIRLLDKKRLDVIVIGQCNPAMFPDTIQARIIERVEAGAGLVYARSGALDGGPLAQWLQQAAALEKGPAAVDQGAGPLGLTRAEREELVHLKTAGEGRIAQLTFHHRPTPNHCLIPIPEDPYAQTAEHETNALSLAAKAVLWAAGRAAPDRVSHLVDVSPKGPDDEEIPPGYPREFIEAVRKNAFNQPIRPYVLHLEEPASQTFDVVYQLRVPGAELPAWHVASDTVLSKGERHCALDVIASPGRYFLDLWLTTRKGVVAWHTEELTIAGWPRLARIAITQEGETATWVRPNDHLDVQVEVEPGAVLTAGEDGMLYGRAVDSFGRQVASTTRVLAAAGGTAGFRLELADLIAPLIRVEIFAVPGILTSETNLANRAARAIYYYPVRLPGPHLEPVAVLTTPGPFDYGATRQLDRLRQSLGASALHAPLGVASLLASSSAGLNRIAQAGSLDAGFVSAGAVRTPCLSSPAFRENQTTRIKAGVLESWAGGPPMHSLGAGTALTDTEANVCQGPDCLAYFREALRERYASLEALNEAWGASFPHWDDVTPRPLYQCQRDGQWAPWLDFRLAMNEVLAGAVARGRQAVLEVPGAGYTGFQSPAGPISTVMGYDWQRLSAVTDFLTAPADAASRRRLQSYHRRQPYSGVVLGGGQVEDDPARASWLAWDSILRQLPAVWLDRPINRGARSLVSPSGAHRPGLARLGQALEVIHGGLGTLLLEAQPHPSGIAFADSPATRYLDEADPDTDRAADASEDALEHALNAAGFTAAVRPLNGSLDDLNTLILGRIRVLSAAEIEAIAHFHNRGGLILADGRPGAFDGHGVPRSSAALPFLHRVAPDRSGEPFALWTNRPVWVSQIGDDTGHITLLHNLLVRAGNEPMSPLRLPDKQAGDVSRYQFTFGAATILAFLPDPGLETTFRRASVDVPEGHHAYDMRQTLETSPRGRLRWNITPEEPDLFAMLPYKVDAVRVEAPELALAGERLTIQAFLDTGEAAPGPHYLELRLSDPSGVELRHYRQCHLADEGQLRTYIPLAENEAPGFYALEVRDVLTRQSDRVLIKVQ